MRGRITIKIDKRNNLEGVYYDKMFTTYDKLQMYNFVDKKTGREGFYLMSVLSGRKVAVISRDESAFIKLVRIKYGIGDFLIWTWAKGKEKGIRILWDGIIHDKTFFRRKQLSSASLSLRPSMMSRQSNNMNTEQYIGRYFKTKKPGVWYNI